LSFLEVKYHTLLSYLINVSYVVLRKSSGVTICNDPSIGKFIATEIIEFDLNTNFMLFRTFG
jgi:hypothetical protein